jgi:hypothetical protein
LARGGELIGLGEEVHWSGLTAKFPNIPTIYHTVTYPNTITYKPKFINTL